MATAKDIAKIIAKLSLRYPNWLNNRNDDEIGLTNEVYFEDLHDLETDLLMTAAQHCVTSTARDQRFAPSPGEIRQAASEIRRQVLGVPSAVEAWGELLHAPTNEKTRQATDEKNEEGRTIIEERPYQWSHPLVRKVAVMLGFPRFPDWHQESFERNTFIKAYESELQNYLKADNQPAQVRNYIDQQDHARLMANQNIKQLTKGMEK